MTTSGCSPYCPSSQPQSTFFLMSFTSKFKHAFKE
jgi:hypothetical protein